MNGQAIIKPQSLTAKMDAGYPKGVKGGNSSITTVDESTDTTIITEQVRASVIINENITLSGLQTQDGINLTERETVVVNGQTDKKENGIYLVQSGAWARHSQKLYGGLTISITSGNRWKDTFWLIEKPDVDATIGTDEIQFKEITATQAIEQIYIKEAQNTAFLWKMLNCAICDLKDALNKQKREDICHAYGFQFATPFNVPNITDYTIPFFYLKYQPTHGTFTTGEFTAGLAGYYDVDVRLSDIDGTKTPGECWLRINGTDCDRIAVTGQLFELQGSMKVYCNPGDKIKASLYQNSGVDMPFYAIAAPAPIGYLSISYCGSRDAANII